MHVKHSYIPLSLHPQPPPSATSRLPALPPAPRCSRAIGSVPRCMRIAVREPGRQHQAACSATPPRCCAAVSLPRNLRCAAPHAALCLRHASPRPCSCAALPPALCRLRRAARARRGPLALQRPRCPRHAVRAFCAAHAAPTASGQRAQVASSANRTPPPALHRQRLAAFAVPPAPRPVLLAQLHLRTLPAHAPYVSPLPDGLAPASPSPTHTPLDGLPEICIKGCSPYLR